MLQIRSCIICIIFNVGSNRIVRMARNFNYIKQIPMADGIILSIIKMLFKFFLFNEIFYIIVRFFFLGM